MRVNLHSTFRTVIQSEKEKVEHFVFSHTGEFIIILASIVLIFNAASCHGMNGPQRTACLAKGYTFRYVANVNCQR